MAEKTWGDIQRRWGSIVAQYTVEQTKDLIRSVVEAQDDFATYSLLLILKYRWDCPDPVFDLLDEIWALQKRRAPEEEFAAWGDRAGSVLRQVIGDEPKSAELLRPPRARSSTEARRHARPEHHARLPAPHQARVPGARLQNRTPPPPHGPPPAPQARPLRSLGEN